MAGLCGVKQISEYLGYSESTVMRWILNEGLPATKIGGSWVSDPLLIDRWIRRRIVEACKNRPREVK